MSAVPPPSDQGSESIRHRRCRRSNLPAVAVHRVTDTLLSDFPAKLSPAVLRQCEMCAHRIPDSSQSKPREDFQQTNALVLAKFWVLMTFFATISAPHSNFPA